MWLFRCRTPGPDEFSYRKRSIMSAMVILITVTTPVELLLFELLIPRLWLRWILLIAGGYTLVWTFAYYASLVVLSHRLAESGLQFHYGFLASVTVPYADVEKVDLAPRRSPKASEGLQTAPAENAAYLSVGGKTDIALHLRSAHPVEGLLKPILPVMTLHIAVDDPMRFVEALQLRCAGARIRKDLGGGDGVVTLA
jgi:hypothetical protein